jgi:hypothetical protein
VTIHWKAKFWGEPVASMSSLLDTPLSTTRISSSRRLGDALHLGVGDAVGESVGVTTGAAVGSSVGAWAKKNEEGGRVEQGF